MVDSIKWLLCSHGQRFGSHQPDDQSADQSWPSRGCYCIDIGKLHVSIVQCAGNQPVQRFDMGACGDLRHHTAIGFVLGDLA